MNGSSFSRRQLLAASGIAGGGYLLAGCGGSSRPTASALPGRVLSADVEALNGLLEVEYHARAAYIAGLPLLKGGAWVAARHFLKQELSHIAELTSLVKKAHAAPRGPRPSYDLGHPNDGVEALKLLGWVEQLTIAAYLAAIPKLSPGLVKAAAASILANEAQHASVVRLNLGLAPVPHALVTGGG